MKRFQRRSYAFAADEMPCTTEDLRETPYQCLVLQDARSNTKFGAAVNAKSVAASICIQRAGRCRKPIRLVSTAGMPAKSRHQSQDETMS